MTSLTEQPKNINPLADVQFKFDVAALPNTSFFIQTVNLPGIALEAQTVATPQLQNFSRHTGIITYEALDVTFMIDEYLKNWQEVYEGAPNIQLYTSNQFFKYSSTRNATLSSSYSITPVLRANPVL